MGLPQAPAFRAIHPAGGEINGMRSTVRSRRSSCRCTRIPNAGSLQNLPIVGFRSEVGFPLLRE